MKKDTIKFTDAVDLILKCNPNLNRESLIEEMITAILTGELEFSDQKAFDDFYFYCKSHVDKDKNSSHPLNWINMFLHSSMLNELKSKEKPGLHPMVKAIKETKCGVSFEFIIHPTFLAKKWKDDYLTNNEKYVKMTGILRFEKDEFYFEIPNLHKILLKFCWIIK